ncbi:hypothetical protein BCR35DRAFT_282858 [Leucosporidium creatinivorum]|uniref:Large ribosomal subunit protein mL44 n=1 Tax=Leucosporidium creatinivorum TaxID=106004 RepID=A0A1Y2E7H7_9BASI|nr:hypothetical protein BCR35DRAFT_282858 [Leucosporidium creatinivorum]
MQASTLPSLRSVASHCGPSTSARAASSWAHQQARSEGKFAREQQRRTKVAEQARSFSCTASTSAAPQLAYNHLISPRPPIPSEIKSARKAPAAPAADALDASEESPAVEDDGYVPPPLTNQSLSLLYSFTTPPPTSSLSAFANRLALSTPSAPEHSLAEHLPLLEQCLIHPSFWAGVSNLPPTTTPHRYTNFHDSPLNPTSPSPLHASNSPLATLGNSLLGTLTSELILTSFPNLPTRVSKAATTMYVGPKSLAAVAGAWGVGPSRLDRRDVGKPDQGKVTRKEMAYGHLVGGVGGARKKDTAVEGAAGAGLVRWNRTPSSPARDAVLFEDALASVSRAIVGAIYQIHGFAATRAFVHSHFLSRLLPPASSSFASPTATSDIIPLLKFTNPTRVLTLTLQKSGLEPASHRLLKESGRLSAHSTFVSGVYSGEEKLGEGFGSSIKMSEWRASEDALRRMYLGGRVKGDLPSETWVSEGKAFEGVKLGEVEVDQESRR